MSKLKQYLEGASKYDRDLVEILDILIYDPKSPEIIASSIERSISDANELFNAREFLIKLQANLDDILRNKQEQFNMYTPDKFMPSGPKGTLQ